MSTSPSTIGWNGIIPTDDSNAIALADWATSSASTATSASSFGSGSAELGEQRVAHRCGALGVERVERRAALHDRTAEQSAGERRSAEVEHDAAARRFAEHGDAFGIATERGDVVADPLECRDRVAEPAVGDTADVARVEEAERAEPVVARDDDDVLFRAEPRAVVRGLRRGADGERAAGKPHEHRPRQLMCRRAPRR